MVKDSRGFHFGELLSLSVVNAPNVLLVAGDTAQAISMDSNFRFADIKALFYEHFINASRASRQDQLARTTLFTLSKNFRSHEGIIALSSLVMDLIWKGRPIT